jgi:hypothetical protein
MIGAVLAASASFATLPAAAAYATQPAGSVSPAVPYCGVPNPIPRSHTKSCGIGFYYHDFIYQYGAGPGGQRDCYVFWSHLSDLGCGSDPGHETSICVG